jgi:tRNA modification GTPase
LFNRLVERERAIVTAAPGTTRDLVSETVAIGGIPVELVDTAGIRRARDEAEGIGIRKSMEALADADLVLVVLDASLPLAPEDDQLLAQVGERPAILVENKADLARSQTTALGSHLRRVRTSAITGEGIPELRAEIFRHVGGEPGPAAETGFLTNLRHQELVGRSAAALDAARTAVRNKIPHEMLLMDLYNALHPLDEITGSTTTDDILSLIFSTFCIGK